MLLGCMSTIHFFKQIKNDSLLMQNDVLLTYKSSALITLWRYGMYENYNKRTVGGLQVAMFFLSLIGGTFSCMQPCV